MWLSHMFSTHVIILVPRNEKKIWVKHTVLKWNKESIKKCHVMSCSKSFMSCAQWLSCVWLFEASRTVDHQAPLPMEFFQARILEWGCHFLLQGIFPTQGLNPRLLCLLFWLVGSLSLVPSGTPPVLLGFCTNCLSLTVNCMIPVCWHQLIFGHLDLVISDISPIHDLLTVHFLKVFALLVSFHYHLTG